jgi:hypothetical protein
MSYDDRRAVARREDAELDAALDEMGAAVTVPPEWRVTFALLNGGWPGSTTRSEQLAYLTFLSDLEPRAVARAVRELARRGVKYRPTPSEVRAVVAPADGGPAPVAEVVPTFDEAWRLVVDAGRDTAFNEGEAEQLLEAVAPPVAAWSRQRGLTALWQLPVEDPGHGRLVLRDLADSWQAFEEAWREPARRARLARPRAAGGLRRLAAGDLAQLAAPQAQGLEPGDA